MASPLSSVRILRENLLVNSSKNCTVFAHQAGTEPCGGAMTLPTSGLDSIEHDEIRNLDLNIRLSKNNNNIA